MALTTVSTGGTILATDINQLVNTLQRPSGQSESGKYYIGGAAAGAGAYFVIYVRTHSQSSTPVSSFIDTADFAPSNVNAPAISSLTIYGFAISTTSSAGNNTCKTAGNWTITY